MIITQDSGIRANQSGFGTSSGGETYTITGIGTTSIASNELVIVSNGSDTHAQLGTRTTGNSEILCRIAIGNTNDVCGIQTRFSASGGNTTCYKLLWYGGNLHINKSVAGANTQITTVAFTMTTGTFYWFRLRAEGSSISGRAWQSVSAEPGNWLTTTTDGSVTGVGGFALLGNTAAASQIQFDNFTAMSLVNIVRPQRRSIGRIPQ